MENEILVVGAGPVGMVLACVLAEKGIKVKIVDKREHLSSLPRAINITAPVIKIFEKLNIIHDVLKNGLIFEELIAFWNGRPLLNINYKYYKPSFPYFIHLEQSNIENYLRDRLESLGVRIERTTSVKSLCVNHENIDVKFENSKGREWNEKFLYVIGCDGGRSTIRELAGIKSRHKDYSSHFILVDGEVESLSSDGLSQLQYYFTEKGYLIVAPLPDNKCRLIASFRGRLDEGHSGKINKNEFQKILNDRLINHVELKQIIWATSGNYFHRIADTAQSNRVFLAGDSLHQFSPVGGANMNVGIQDAYSLGQKFISYFADSRKQMILSEYSKERLAVARKYIEVTESMTGLMTRTSSIADQDKFLPQMKNRKYLKHTLPQMFSGEYFNN